jgi:hypothetical protein
LLGGWPAGSPSAERFWLISMVDLAVASGTLWVSANCWTIDADMVEGMELRKFSLLLENNLWNWTYLESSEELTDCSNPAVTLSGTRGPDMALTILFVRCGSCRLRCRGSICPRAWAQDCRMLAESLYGPFKYAVSCSSSCKKWIRV